MMGGSRFETSWSRRVLTLLLTTLALYALALLVIFLVQDWLVYRPSGPPDRTPAARGWSFRDETLLTADGERLGAWWIPAPAPRGAVVVSHGNGGHIGHRLGLAGAFRDMGLSVLLYDYRGYGRSTGRPSEEGTYSDAEAAHDYVTGEAGFEPAQVILYGESLGGAVAVELALRRPVAAVIAESTFTSVGDIGSEVYRWLPAGAIARHRYDTASKIDRLDVPVLVVHSPEDRTASIAHGQRLFELATEPKAFLATSGDHNDGGFLLRPADIAAVAEFVDGVLGEAP